MIYKKRKMPNELKALISLNKRLPKQHEKKHAVQKNLLIYQAGYNGELEFDQQMAEFKPDYSHAILHDLYLQHEGDYFQIDSLLITPSSIKIIEVKNFKDKTVIKANPTQFIRVFRNGDRKPIPNPIIEVNRKIQYLSKWLTKRGIQIPIEGILTFSDTNELAIENPSPEMKILLNSVVPTYLSSLPETQQILNKQAIHELANTMLAYHKDYNPFPIADLYGISASDIKPGVICPSCNELGMRWGREKWNCLCGHTGKNEHDQTIEDWFMLIKPKMTNRDFRYFTKLDNRNIARGLLAKTALLLVGERKAAHYVLIKEGKSPLLVE
ncbi:nuclease-related domain-containing protein [Sporosarcina highlanderae]|uniref:Nuclease-related domain-containing protein n=1 Tax=Sporosarcina highlanderae TaxID=3035916 RepID=A0ABT8JLE5_9BACL|nr:nuclease-related domain-containing protein [Sporosarcina highlanderae]MDN4605965.1 nuclease-related domain-containing protein [Sporosarcina highlanderae]